MKRYIKTIFFLILILILFSITFPTYAYTDILEEVNIDITIDDNGNANVTEVWITEVASGTENYKPYSDLQTSNIINFSVTDETGVEYTYINIWNIDASRTEKKDKCGINKTTDGIELCWGVGDYGKHTYTLKYTITNFIQEYEDYQAIYFGLMPSKMNLSPKSVNISIETRKKL